MLVAGYAEPLVLWALVGDLADVAGCPVNLLDLRAASTVMQYQVITTGQCWWALDAQAVLFEVAILSEKTELDTARAGLLSDIQKRERSMADDVLINKAANIERCVARAWEEYVKNSATFPMDLTSARCGNSEHSTCLRSSAGHGATPNSA